uniref:RNase H type-1 domain-containing protein n=1 Tax=Fagus sylvatica TaxID=28930 RepID=A0A2N9GM00_FAGSY
MEEITSLWDRLSLTAKEEVRVDLSDEQETKGGVLAAKFFTKRVINIDAVLRTLKPIWRAESGLKGRNMGNNKAMFLFENTIHDLPPRHMTVAVCKKIASTLGQVEYVEDFDEGSSRGNFMRARILLDVDQPLCQGQKQYGPWLRGDLRRVWRGPTVDGHPVKSGQCTQATTDGGGEGLGRSREATPIKENTSNMPACQGVTDMLTFTEHLKEIDRDLGLPQGFFQVNVQMPAHTDVLDSNLAPEAGSTSMEFIPPGLFETTLNGLATMRPTMEPIPTSAQIDKPKKSNGDIGGGCIATPPDAMSCLAWNCRGLGNPQTVHELSIMVRKKDPLVLFLSETKLDENQLEVLRCYWKFVGKFVVPSRGLSGGLVLFWSGGKLAAWGILRILRNHHDLPWLCSGDFNELLSRDEKWGRRPRPESQMLHFCQVVDECGFMDLGFLGPSFTWCNNQTGGARVLERLDRSFATTKWLVRFPNCRVHHLPTVFSNHCLLWMELYPTRTSWSRRRLFRFEEMWTMDPRCEETVQQAWSANVSGSPMFQVSEKIKASRHSLHRWSKQQFGSVRFSIEMKTKQLEEEEAAAPAAQNALTIKNLCQELYNLHVKEEKMWKQRSRNQWLQNGDRNTRFFHCQATLALAEVLEGVAQVVTIEMNDQLLQEFTAGEVEQAIFQMGPLKAPGPDDEIGTTRIYGFECMQSVSYSVLINGEPKGYLHPSRGLRQGNPISPYLFLLCAEGLHALLTRATVLRQLQGATLMECNTIMEILRRYESVSGQQLNHDKTILFFSASTTVETQEEIKDALHLPVIKQYETYLGLPSMVGRSKYASFTHLKERMWHKVQGWKKKLLTQAGKEVLIKAVIQAIPTYTMHCFKLPKKLCIELEGIIRNFWWGHKGESRKVHWLKWSSMCRPKCLGGMGFRDLMKFNEALLEKQVWRLIHNKESLMYKVFKAKFFPHGMIMDARHSARASYAWKSILNARHVITQGSRWRIGNGLSTKIWSDKWLPPPSSGKPLTPPCILAQDADAQLITGMVLSARRVDDKLIWSREKRGTYSVRSAYRLLCENIYANEPGCSNTGMWKQFWRRVWSIKVPHKVQQFLWHACTNSLPTLVNMHRRGIVPMACCSFCQLADEDVRHALWCCPALTLVWASNVLASKLFRRHHSSFLDILSDLFELGSAESIAVLVYMLWLLWNRRNKALYHNEFESLDLIPMLALRLSSKYLTAQELPAISATIQPRLKWKPPSISAFKINFDAALFNDQQCTGVGVIIRDDQGLPIAALCKRLPYLYAVDDAEALAAREALQFAVETRLSDAEVEVEGDFLTICNALKCQDSSFASYGDIIDEACLVARSFQGCSFSHVKQEGNRAAHMLACRAIELQGDFLVWLEDVPPYLEAVIHSELSLAII